jgi:LAO/AO transport system kinase
MQELSVHHRAFVRPSPSGGALGGLSYWAADCVSLMHAAGYRLIFIETVGVGQSETLISDVTDMTLLLVPPGGGDDLQGMKKGIMEVADMVVINKADGDLLTTARHTKMDYHHALQLTRHNRKEWRVPVLLCSSLKDDMGLKYAQFDQIWTQIQAFFHEGQQGGLVQRERLKSAEKVTFMHVDRQLHQHFQTSLVNDPTMRQMWEDTLHTPSRVRATQLVKQFLR